MPELVLIAHNLRSTHNVGSLLRTADGLGVHKVLLTGYTPYPALPADDPRLPHIAAKLNRQIHKTALGAEQTVDWRYSENVTTVIGQLKHAGYSVAALEQAPGSIALPDFQSPSKLALIVGREVEGIEPEILHACDITLEIPMYGKKESFNVSVASAIALYHCSINAA